jgi:sugar phosphate isomerase/epimerase
LRFAFNTNGCANHRLSDAVRLIADAGYDGVALTLDHHHLDPLEPGWERRTQALRADLDRFGLGSVIETGARFLLDPERKHEPTLISADAEGRARRVRFLQRATEIACMLGSETVSFWAGIPRGIDLAQARQWLRSGLSHVLEFAEPLSMPVSLEPEPGMLIETVDDWADLASEFPGLRLALDLGHLIVTGERNPAEAIGEFADRLGTVALEDMRRGEHVHLPFGEGDMDVAGCVAALDRIGFDRLVCVELSRESHRADRMVPESRDWLARHAGHAAGRTQKA